MSYSYVKTVFPDFKYSNVYDTKLYETKLDNNNSGKNIYPVPADQNEMIGAEIKQEPKIETFQNNQKFYNIPIPSLPESQSEEKFDNATMSHLDYTKHILECPSCKQVLMKQFNIETDRLKNEEIMELISFIMFGIFILLLLDSLKK